MQPSRPNVSAWSRRHPFRATVLFGWWISMLVLALVPGSPLAWLFWVFLILTVSGIPMAVAALRRARSSRAGG